MLSEVSALCIQCSGTASHRSGGRSFPRHCGTMPLGQGVGPPALDLDRVPDAAAVAKKMKSFAKELVATDTREHKALEERRLQAAEAVLREAEQGVAEIVEGSRFLREAMSWKRIPHTCPMLSGVTAATEACDKNSHWASAACSQRAAAWHTRHLGVQAPPAENMRGFAASECMTAGICVCGTPIRTFWRAASGVIENQCQDKPSQDKLVSGFLLVLWVGTAEPLSEDNVEGLSDARCEATHIPWHF